MQQLKAMAEREESEIIEANCMAYDTLDQREDNLEKNSEMAGQVMDRIKSIKKLVKDQVRTKV